MLTEWHKCNKEGANFMDYMQKIKEELKKYGRVITSKEHKNCNIPTIYFTRMVEKENLIHVKSLEER